MSSSVRSLIIFSRDAGDLSNKAAGIILYKPITAAQETTPVMNSITAEAR